jgi:hypothetical protein
LIGYSTCSAEFATWSAAEFLHIDTLYVEEGFRGLGIGKHLLDAVVAHASMLGLTEVQWQTPDWNTDAVRFYERVGAVSTNKIRFKLPVTTTDGQKPNSEVLELFTRAWSNRDAESLASCLHAEAQYSPSVEVQGAPFVGIRNVVAGIQLMWLFDDDAVVQFGPSLQDGCTITRTWVYSFVDRPSQYGVDVFTFAGGKIIHKDAYRRQPSR